MAEPLEPQEQPEDVASPVPNRRERRGGKSSGAAAHGGKSGVGRRSGPAAPARQYSTRRRSG
ncbi:MAG: hypothetical protein QOJ06_966 [Pseudonocardiales bacterium]|jgi:hypothetical protein|nr:hypothetical protein [Pseudonocardiales bacterium]HZE02743.1 hypothetical protein [Pseudonocardiaceae bacterium]